MKAREVGKAGAHGYGIDISPVSIEKSRQLAQQEGVADRATFAVMDAEAMEFPDGFFDAILVNGALHHLDLANAYRELARVLKPDGIVVANEALKHNIFIHLYRKMTPHLRTAWEAEHIMGKGEIESAHRYFNRVEVLRCFHLATLLAIPSRTVLLV